jgi:DNA segregation ATPase FtsK/SpoIIIE-like protein
MSEATVRRELTPEELQKLGPHAGHIQRQIDLKRIARKEAMDSAKLEISELEDELNQVLKELHDGFRLEPAQAEMWKDSRIDDAREVVRKAREKYASEAESFEDDEEQPESEPAAEQMPADDLDPELIDAAIKLRDSGERLTTSVLRRRLRIGKAKAQRILDALEATAQ